ncbi:hypothetical protein DU508_11530 [Pedobacter chinensis]|uniref:Uncharacterized protein n=1 Tax=Pedobacter chinensis TaxID=2282421 RepID=A0A369PYE5_9SPHI|nr:hypothetical protein [Pedobacter chinensis]RDC56235.1 hypothetical protein DU508_11530 [Pedobacter chinensis]
MKKIVTFNNLKHLGFLLLYMFCYSAKAETGCMIGSVLYRGNEFGIIDITFNNATIVNTLPCAPNDQTTYNAREITTLTLPILGARRCRITSGIFDPYPGLYSSYSWVRCSIDDYIPYFLLGFGGLGFVFIRKRNLAI